MQPGPSRRDALALGAAVLGAAWLEPARARESAAPIRPSTRDEDRLDDALALLQREEPLSRQGLSTHAPMAAEALCALGFGERALTWVEGYDRRRVQLPRPERPIDPERWRESLGRHGDGTTWERSFRRFGDWRVLFESELERAPWPRVLDTWAARLAPGLAGAATHGVIRTAHAARALARRDSEPRRKELARGLAYWAASYQELSPSGAGARSAAERARTMEDALRQLPSFWRLCAQTPPGNIADGLQRVSRIAGFDRARALIAAPTTAADVGARLSELSRTFARVYLRHGTRHDAIAFVHAVTGPVALRRLAPHVSPETALLAFPYAWEAAAAIHVGYARPDDAVRATEPRLAPAEIAERAARNGDEHAIKLAEVLLAEHAIAPDPVYLAAAEDVVARL